MRARFVRSARAQQFVECVLRLDAYGEQTSGAFFQLVVVVYRAMRFAEDEAVVEGEGSRRNDKGVRSLRQNRRNLRVLRLDGVSEVGSQVPIPRGCTLAPHLTDCLRRCGPLPLQFEVVSFVISFC